MNKIKVLDSSIFNLISAGEVIERPASVVKELVENAIDAKASSIKVEISDGGKVKIRVSDDGAGIPRDSVETAFLPHATSKLSVASDLNCINTLGFRGEALASISAVSKIEVQTCTDEDDGCASYLEIEASRIENKSEIGGKRGTSICVNNLFFNTPARYKFLKSTKGEENEITFLMQRFILANPQIAFTYIVDKKTIFQTKGGKLCDAISAVYNREIISNFNLIENTLGGFSLKGFVSSPNFFKGNRSYQTIIINGRIVENKTIQTSVEKAYEGFLMKRCFPLYVLELTVPTEFLDVNVHPCKTEVRFQDNNRIFSFVYHSIRKFLDNFASIKEINENFETTTKNDSGFHDEIACDNSDIVEKTSSMFSPSEAILSEKPIDYFCDSFKNTTKNNFLRSDSGIAYRAFKAAESVKNYCNYYENIQNFEENHQGIDQKLINQNITEHESNAKPLVISEGFVGKIIGQLFSTYILIENEDCLYVIDQHAAHERLIYDSLVNNTNNDMSQSLLIPYIFETNLSEYDFMNRCVSQLQELGFDIEPFGNLSFKVSAVPCALTDINFDKFFAEILNDLSRIPNLKTSDILKDKLAQNACKNAVKAGDSLNDLQIDALISSFKLAEKTPLQCPHGRPCVIKITKFELEKWFKRIV